MRLAVVSAIWQRPERLPYTLGQLAAQTDPAFDLLLVNNNPVLAELVNEQAARYPGSVVVTHYSQNRGPFARLEVMHEHAGDYDAFMTVDDDLDFPPSLVADWKAQADPGAVLGWMGFRFTGNYWQRETVEAGEDCSYLWGSNLLVPAAAVQDGGLLNLPADYWQCDDLWLCYYASHVLGLALRRADTAVKIAVDGKDTYPSQQGTKVRLLESLRAKGWQV